MSHGRAHSAIDCFAVAMDTTRFTSMPTMGESNSGIAALLMSLNPKEMACDVVTTVTTWTSAAVTQCFSRMRRVQFDEEHQRSLLSCHTTDEGEFQYPDEAAMLELRRRVQKVDLHGPKRSSFAQDLEATYNRHKAMQMEQSRLPSRGRAKVAPRRDPEVSNQVPELSTVSIDLMLEPQQEPGQDKLDDLRRLSVDELLAMPASPEKTGGQDEQPEILSEDALALRQWLSGIDAARSDEYATYARQFEQQGFQTLEDLGQLDENDVEHAMSEIGIAKFAHRARIRKAILRLHGDVAPIVAGNNGDVQL
ncbi:hypothetical protein Poli38472_011086 [Pythium oligandrum]|uniref:SAM domain-containing protein n=1 Tax=Pythium oligandrum TaxID=41045 RepID=A0A8K1CRR4_PYTOL|nr:hypothetical protein Poli38472_011086 [Pythium oligandrum]|eukprot:TMW67466.1 hypothetical protein Poli38472_011086 [Pythium oligandrum]